jgi:hypothetical protein
MSIYIIKTGPFHRKALTFDGYKIFFTRVLAAVEVDEEQSATVISLGVVIGIGDSGSYATPLPHHQTCGFASGGSES